MAWNHDKGVIEYLEQRLRYYKVRHRKVSKWIVLESKNNKISFVVCEQWRKSFSLKKVRQIISHYEKRISEYQEAIDILKK